MILLAKIITCASYHAERQDFPLYFQNNSAELEQFPSIWCELHALIITLPVIWLLAACLCALGTLSVSCPCPFSCYAFFLFSLLPLFPYSTITYNLSSEQVHLWLNSDPPFTSITSAGRGGEVRERVTKHIFLLSTVTRTGEVKGMVWAIWLLGKKNPQTSEKRILKALISFSDTEVSDQVFRDFSVSSN